MPSQSRLTHFNDQGEAHMVDVSDKNASDRRAIAEGRIRMSPQTLARIVTGDHDKGDVLAVARIAGIMGAKHTPELVPLCHPIMLTGVSVEFDIDDQRSEVHCTATTRTRERTGVEMEAMVAVQIALVTIYDMCKSADRGMEMSGIRLVHKSGGKSGEWNRDCADTDIA